MKSGIGNKCSCIYLINQATKLNHKLTTSTIKNNTLRNKEKTFYAM